MSEIDQGPVGRTSEVIPEGWRKAVFTFTQKTDSDERFAPAIEEAMLELIALDPYGATDRHVAKNGVVVHVAYPHIGEVQP